MAASLIAADSMLVLDVGAVHTRALLFDVVDGAYRFIAGGAGQTTAYAPFKNIGEGIHQAIEHLQTITGRTLLSTDGRLISPSQADGSGVDGCVATLSVGGPLRVVTVGLLEDISVESAQNLASATYAQLVDSLSLNDRRRGAARIDAILRARPDLIIVAGGSEGGASQSVMSLIETVGLACHLFPDRQRPEVLYAGNQALAENVKSALEGHAPFTVAPNIRPTLETEQLAPAQTVLSQVYRQVRQRKLAGMNDLDTWTAGHILPGAAAFARLLPTYNLFTGMGKNAFGIEVSASATTVAAAVGGELIQRVYPAFGLGESLSGLLNHTSLEELAAWLPLELPSGYLHDYLYNKSLYPSSLPATTEDLAIEQALARQLMRLAIHRTSSSFPASLERPGAGLLPWFEEIIAAGSVLTQSPTRGQALLMLLDGIQPTGLTYLILDQNHLLSALGAAASVNPVLAVQGLEEASLLAWVINCAGAAPAGTVILRVRVTYDNGNTATVDVKNGSLELIPLAPGQKANVRVQPFHKFDVGMGPGRGGEIKRVDGSAFGIVIDARGRPLRPASEPTRRKEFYKKWLSALGG